jgi:hypothetical protein
VDFFGRQLPPKHLASLLTRSNISTFFGNRKTLLDDHREREKRW